MENQQTVLSEEEKKEILEDYRELIQNGAQMCSKIDMELGRNHPLAAKIRNIWEIIDGLTEEEIIIVANFAEPDVS